MDKNAKFGLLVGSGTMIGLGVGFFLLPNGVAFVGSIMLGIGAGLLAAVLYAN
jgi:hypothetical protein